MGLVVYPPFYYGYQLDQRLQEHPSMSSDEDGKQSGSRHGLPLCVKRTAPDQLSAPAHASSSVSVVPHDRSGKRRSLSIAEGEDVSIKSNI